MEPFLLIGGIIAFLWLASKATPSKKKGDKQRTENIRDDDDYTNRTTQQKKQYPLDVVGESHYQIEIGKIAGRRRKEGYELPVEATLICADNNSYDKNAVRVEIKGQTVGHLSREDAKKWREQLAKKGLTNTNQTCDALIVGGWNRGPRGSGSYGVRLKISL